MSARKTSRASSGLTSLGPQLKYATAANAAPSNNGGLRSLKKANASPPKVEVSHTGIAPWVGAQATNTGHAADESLFNLAPIDYGKELRTADVVYGLTKWNKDHANDQNRSVTGNGAGLLNALTPYSNAVTFKDPATQSIINSMQSAIGGPAGQQAAKLHGYNAAQLTPIIQKAALANGITPEQAQGIYTQWSGMRDAYLNPSQANAQDLKGYSFYDDYKKGVEAYHPLTHGHTYAATNTADPTAKMNTEFFRTHDNTLDTNKYDWRPTYQQQTGKAWQFATPAEQQAAMAAATAAQAQQKLPYDQGGQYNLQTTDNMPLGKNMVFNPGNYYGGYNATRNFLAQSGQDPKALGWDKNDVWKNSQYYKAPHKSFGSALGGMALGALGGYLAGPMMPGGLLGDALNVAGTASTPFGWKK